MDDHWVHDDLKGVANEQGNQIFKSVEAEIRHLQIRESRLRSLE